MDQAATSTSALSEAARTALHRLDHDLRTPLNVIQGFAALARKDPASADQALYLDQVIEQADVLQRLLDERITPLHRRAPP
ncbi:MAG: histidine kinase dimerization/phospho-acceptor domain-containing protein [Pseudomonadota bacterium]